jgi:hypothetical protein
MSIPNISRVNTIDEWRIQTNDSADALNTLETGAYEKTAGSLTIKNDASLVITSNGTALQVSNAAQFSTNVSIGRELFLGARETSTGNLTVGKEVVIQGSGNALTVANNATVNNNLQVTKTITTNNITVNSNVTVTGTTDTGSLIVDADATVGTTLVVTGNVTGGNVTTTGATDTGRLAVTNGATVGTTLGVTGNTTSGNLTTTGATDTGRLVVTNGATVGTTLGVTGNTTSGNLTTTGATDTGRLAVTNGATVGGALSVTGNTVTGNLNTSGVANSETLRVVSNATVGGTLGVTGNTTSGNLTTTGTTDTGRLAVTNGATVGSTLSVGTTLSVTSNATVGNLTTSGATDTGRLQVTNGATVGGTLGVTGNTTSGNLTTTGATDTGRLAVTNGATVGASLSVGTTLSVTGNAAVGNLNTSGVANSETLRVVSGATVGGTLAVTGNTTSGNLTTTGATDTGRLQVTNGATVGSTLAVTGNTTTGNLNTSGVANSETLRVVSGATIGGAISASSTTDASSSSSGGALTVSGGTAIAKKLFVGGATELQGLTAGATTLASGSVTGAFTVGGDLQVTGSTIYLGPTLNDTDTLILRGLTRQTPGTGYDYFAVNRTKLPVTLNVTTNTVNTSVSHAFSNGQSVVLTSIVGTTNIGSGTTYRVLNFAGSQAFYLTTNYGSGNTIVDLTGVNGTATLTDADSYDAQFRWDEANKVWDIRNTTDGTYSKVLLRSDLSDSTSSTSTTTPASSAAANTLSTRIRDLNTSQVAENTGYLYLTATRVRANVSNTAPINYNSTTGVFSHATSGVTASGYGDSISIPVFVVNDTGHVTGVTNTTVRSATTSQTGVTQLTDSTSSTSTSTAATPNSVKTTYDAIGTANTNMKTYVDNKFAPLAGAAFTGDVSVTGNLTVTGLTTYMNTNTLNIGDNILTLNADLPSGTAPTENAGIEVNRGSSTNVYVRWDESIDSWVANNGITANEYRLANTTTYLTEGTNLYFTAARVRSNVSATTPISYDSGTGIFSHATSGVTAATYANSTHVPVITVNASGHVTGISNTPISYSSDFATVTASASKSSYTWTANSGSAVADSVGDTLTVVGGDNIIVSSNTNLDAILIEHADTSSLTGKQGSAGIKSVTVDGAGHVTAVETETYLTGQSSDFANVIPSNAKSSYTWTANGGFALADTVGDALTIVGGDNIIISGNVTGDAILIEHSDTSALSGKQGSAGIKSVTVDGAGHVTAVETETYLTSYTETDTLQTVTTRGATTDKAISITNTTKSTSEVTGALTISGGVGVSGNVYLSGNVITTGLSSYISAEYFKGGVNTVGYTSTTSAINSRGIITANTNSTQTPIVSIVSATGDGNGNTLELKNRASGSANCFMSFRADSESISYEKYFGILNNKITLWHSSSPFGSAKVFEVDDNRITTFYNDVRSTGSFTAGYSDDRLKDKHGNIPNALAKVSAINGFYYTANETAKDLGMSDGMQVGVSSQEVEKIMPEVVVPSALDGYNTVHYEKLVPLLIEAIKELKAEVDELKKNK